MRWLLPTLPVFVAIFTIFFVRLDPDFGWHLRSGQYILHHGLPSTDIFTYTASDFPWINHEWLSDIIIAGAYALGGFAGVAALFAFIWSIALRLAVGGGTLEMMFLGTAAILDTITARPSAWTALGLMLVIGAVRRKQYWRLIGLFALWSNLHGGFVIGLVVVAMVALHDHKYRWVLVGGILATLANPYGLNLYVEIWRTLADQNLRSNVYEWGPLSIGVLSGFYLIIYLSVGASRGWPKTFAMPSLLLLAAVSSMRQFPLFVLASLSLVEAGYLKLVSFLGVGFGNNLGNKRYILPILAIGLISAPVTKIALHPDNQSPIAQVAALNSMPCEGRLFNDYDFGGYIIWKLPQTKVYIDGRMPSWSYNGENYMANWKRDLIDKSARTRDFERYGISCVLIRPKHREIISDLRAQGWVVTSADSQAVLLRAKR